MTRQEIPSAGLASIFGSRTDTDLGTNRHGWIAELRNTEPGLHYARCELSGKRIEQMLHFVGTGEATIGSGDSAARPANPQARADRRPCISGSSRRTRSRPGRRSRAWPRSPTEPERSSPISTGAPTTRIELKWPSARASVAKQRQRRNLIFTDSDEARDRLLRRSLGRLSGSSTISSSRFGHARCFRSSPTFA
jgi:hypothetical protein